MTCPFQKKRFNSTLNTAVSLLNEYLGKCAILGRECSNGDPPATSQLLWYGAHGTSFPPRALCHPVHGDITLHGRGGHRARLGSYQPSRWAVISETATAVLKSVSGEVSPEPRPVPGLAPVTAEDEEETAPEEEEEDTKGEKTLIQRKRDRLRRRDFGLSLLLSNKRIKSRTSLFFDLVFSDLVRSFVEL